MEQEMEQMVQKWIVESIITTFNTSSSSSESSSGILSSSTVTSSTTSSSSSSDTSFDEDDDGMIDGTPRNAIRDFVEITVPAYSAREFRRHFRVSREIADDLIHSFQASDFLPVHTNGPLKVKHDTALLMTLWYLGNLETFRQVADRFDVARSSSHRVLKKTLRFINSLCDRFIKWPNRAEAVQIKRQFKQRGNIDDIIGAIDGCHIAIRRPVADEEAYVNRKSYHSILLQGIVDSRKKFIDIYVGEPGSMHDARVLRRSPIYNPAMTDINTFHGGFLLGDSAYPNLSWLVTPFKNYGNLTEEQVSFNYRHSNHRIVIEHAFGLLKTIFRRLLRFDNISIDIIVECIMAACILHNILVEARNDDYNEEPMDEDEEEDIDYDVIMNRREDVFAKMFNR